MPRHYDIESKVYTSVFISCFSDNDQYIGNRRFLSIFENIDKLNNLIHCFGPLGVTFLGGISKTVKV